MRGGTQGADSLEEVPTGPDEGGSGEERQEEGQCAWNAEGANGGAPEPP